jgi:hypothetical protein
LFVVLVSGALAVSAQESKLAEADQLVGMFGCAPDLTELPPIDLIIDNSKSMTGFVQSEGGGRYRAVINQILRNGFGDKVTIRKLSAPARDPIRQAASLFDPSFYLDDDTPLQMAFDYARLNSARITILLSDLEQSASDEDMRVAEAALVNALKKKRAVLLVGVRSPFSNQQSPRCSPMCAAQQHRYFYLMVMAPSREILRLFVDRTRIDKFAFDDSSDSKYGPPLFYSNRPALEVDNVQLLTDPARGPWTPFRENGHVSCADQTFNRVQASFTYTNAWPSEPLRLLVHVTVHDPVQDFSRTVARIAKVDRPGVAATPQEIPASGLSHSAHRQAFVNDKLVSFKYVFRKPRPHSWNVYRVWFDSKQANIEVPTWVKKCNEQAPATKDAYPALAALVRTIIREVTEKEPMMEHFIAIGQD